MDDDDDIFLSSSPFEPPAYDSRPTSEAAQAPAAGPMDVDPPPIPIPPYEEDISLSPEQQQVLNTVKEGKSVFFTGSAGTGKSMVLRKIITWCKETGPRYSFAVTASTGIAGVNVGGSTVHSWAGVGLAKEPAEQLVGRILGQDKYRRMLEKKLKRKEAGLPPDDEMEHEERDKQPRVVERWRSVRTLIIDEISMIDGKFFDKLEYIARALRGNDKPFGGIQLVLSGDFCQLPPVPDQNKGIQIAATFAFEADSWNRCVGKPIVLKKVFRQKEQDFVDMLNEMRIGRMELRTIRAFSELSRPVEYADGLEPSELFPTRNEVDVANRNRLNQIRSRAHQYNAIDTPGYDDYGRQIPPERVDRLLERLVAPKNIVLKKGAMVMLIKNLEQGVLVNGSTGVVADFCTTREALNRGIKIGLVESKKEDSKPRPGARNSGNEQLRRLKEQLERGVKKEEKVSKELVESSTPYPIVNFERATVLCVPTQFEVNSAEGGIEAMRGQVPLILAWALSIHKSQGQTLERVRVDLGRTFEKGQAHPRVMKWMGETIRDYKLVENGDDCEEEYWDHV
ncbi:hypothetical protein PHLCEN_2v981 [Hermanssonia centrifuga]|uniref:ATP-dependent DNA helicase n=1 Tax=Hermanssonia centrifuga TaxID=98765 RepID=A0A2R6S496_9APHY|nr:hypothetical protein PHLCEN_2v981 [Hermanssonia centrifuga]